MTYRNHLNLTNCCGTAVFRFNPLYGWQVFDWMPSKKVDGISTLVIHDLDNKASLLMIHSHFIAKPRKGRFTKSPHKLIKWRKLQERQDFNENN